MYATAAPPVFSAVDVKSPGQLGTGRGQLQPLGSQAGVFFAGRAGLDGIEPAHRREHC